MTTPADHIAKQLQALGTSGAFATRFNISADPGIQVDGVGALALPVTIHAAHQLCAVARPAMHGYKDQTRLDPRVRDTWEIPARHIQCVAPTWQAALDRALARIGRDLGLPPGARLEAEPHNLLIYAPGQFFAVHQDSEKRDGMLGTLVITLPSRFTGGEFVVSHQGRTLRTRGSARQLALMAFYADCQHEVRPVKQGYRVVLTYNLLVAGQPQSPSVPVAAVDALARAVHAFWNTPLPPRQPQGTPRQPPDRLVYLLDHQYTPSSLGWARLKGVDVTRALALRRVAETLDAEIFLTLADVHETWDAEDDYAAEHRWGYPDDDEDDAADDLPGADGGEVALRELIDSEIELRHWRAPDGGVLDAMPSLVGSDELCLTRASVDCSPFRSEYEGYMGNYGNTMDRWYHRAAVVLWPRERAFAIRARQSPSWAIAQLAACCAAGNAAQAEALARQLLPFWQNAATAGKDAALLAATLDVAAATADGEIASALLAPFDLRQLRSATAPRVLRLLQRHGLARCMQSLRQWAESFPPFAEDRLRWIARTLPALASAWSASALPEGRALALALLDERAGWLHTHLHDLGRHAAGAAGRQALIDTAPAWLALLRSGRAAGWDAGCAQILRSLASAELPLSLPLAVLHAAKAITAADADLQALRTHCLGELGVRLAQPERSAADWSITPPPGCTGELGERLAQFLQSPRDQRLEWPLAEQKRHVIHQLIDRHELPVQHTTRRRGRPYTLVLEKTPALFAQAAAERQQWARELAWLQQTAANPAPRRPPRTRQPKPR